MEAMKAMEAPGLPHQAPPTCPTPAAASRGLDAAAAQRLHRERNARPHRRGRGAEAERDVAQRGGTVVKEVKTSLLEMVKDEPEDDIKIRELEFGGEGGHQRGVKREREEVVAEAGPSGRGAGGQQGGNAGRGTSKFRGVTKDKRRVRKAWMARIHVTEDGKRRPIHIGYFAREEDAARAFDLVNIARLGHAQAKTNFPVAEYQAEWAELEALGVEGAAARERQ